jgi:hypothetical protein
MIGAEREPGLLNRNSGKAMGLLMMGWVFAFGLGLAGSGGPGSLQYSHTVPGTGRDVG